MFDELKNLLFESEVSKAILDYEKDQLKLAFTILERRFALYIGYEDEESTIGLRDFKGAYTSLDDAIAVAVLDLRDYNNHDAIIIDRLKDEEAWNSDSYRAELRKAAWKYNSLDDLVMAAIITKEQYVILKNIPWDEYKNQANAAYPKVGIAHFLKHWTELQKLITQIQEDPRFCQEAKDAIRDGKITYYKALELVNIPIREQPHIVEIMASGGVVRLYGFSKPPTPRWRFGLWQTETMSYGTDDKFNEMKPCDLLWCVAMPCTPQGYKLGTFKNGSFGKKVLANIELKETFEEAVAELLRWPEFKPVSPETFTAKNLRKTLKI